MAVQVKVSGINIVLKDLDKYSKKVQKGVYKEVRDWSERTEAAAKRDVPIGLTGNLQKSIGTKSENNGLTWIVKAGGTPKVNYAPFIEFGTGVGADKSFLQQYGLVDYASQFRGNQPPFSPLPARSFLYRNGRTEFEKTLVNIKKLLQQT